MTTYKINSNFQKNLGFYLNSFQIHLAVVDVNIFLSSLPPMLYRNIDFKTTGSMIGAIFCSKLVEHIPDAAVNPIEKGHPDIIPKIGLDCSEEQLRNYPKGLEIKGTIGNIRNGANLRAGESRINALIGITWQAHHREVNNLLGFIWDFSNTTKTFNFPSITGVFFSDMLSSDDWGEISGTTGRNTKVTGMKISGKTKMGEGIVLISDSLTYTTKYSRLLNIPTF